MTSREILESIQRIFEDPVFKLILSSIGWLLTTLFGQPDAALKAFVVLLVADLVTGIAKAEIRGEAKSFISHEKGRRKYIGYAIVLIVCQALDSAAIPGLRNVALLWGSATEARSIVENLELMGVPMPQFLKEHLKKAKSSLKP